MKPTYSIIVPVYNEEEVITVTHERLSEVMARADGDYEIIYVNDGCRDKSPEILGKICAEDKHARLINFSRNFGHQPAITAGMQYSSGDAVVVIDADLQDPPEVILDMIAEWKKGYEVVYGKRSKRKGETAFKKFTASAFYRVLKSLSSVDIPVDTGDFRLIDRRVCDTYTGLSERTRYVRGLIAWVGYKQKAVEYVREERFAGETKYPLKKMLKLAVDGIASFSVKPLKLATVLGCVITAASLLYLLVSAILWGGGFTPFEGWQLALSLVLFTQGATLVTIGLLGEYLGRMYDEVKHRPIFIVSDTLGFESDSKSQKERS